eukprot:gene871-biopygen131
MALLGIPAFTGNDYVSSFMRKGKQMCWNHIKNDHEFLDLFGNLGIEVHISEDYIVNVEKFVFKMYGEKGMTDVKNARSRIFCKRLKKKNKVIDRSLLPPYSSGLRRQALRANFIARMWRKAQCAKMWLEDPELYGWLHDLTPHWVYVPYPEDVVELLVPSDDIDESRAEQDASDIEE